MALTLLYNPRCSKSREALALLQALGHEPELIDYQATPLDLAGLRALQARLELPARALLREADATAQGLGLDDPALSEDALLTALAAHPDLLQRPIVIDGGRALIARPPERLRHWL